LDSQVDSVSGDAEFRAAGKSGEATLNFALKKKSRLAAADVDSSP
jgi:hypothetical protein